MKTLLYTCLIFISPIVVFSQKSYNRTDLVVSYRFKFNAADLSNGSHAYANTQLLVGKQSSLYRMEPKVMNKPYQAEQGNRGTEMNFKSNGPNIEQYLRIYNPDKNDFVGNWLIKPYYWEQEKPKLKWEIGKDKQMILGYNCSKARMFSERSQKFFTAWFAPDLPFPTGPSNAGGLPGLILKFESDDKSLIWEAQKISKPTEASSIVWFDKEAQKTTKADFDKATQAYRKNPQLMIDQMNIKGAVSGIKIQ